MTVINIGGMLEHKKDKNTLKEFIEDLKENIITIGSGDKDTQFEMVLQYLIDELGDTTVVLGFDRGSILITIKIDELYNWLITKLTPDFFVITKRDNLEDDEDKEYLLSVIFAIDKGITHLKGITVALSSVDKTK